MNPYHKAQLEKMVRDLWTGNVADARLEVYVENLSGVKFESAERALRDLANTEVRRPAPAVCAARAYAMERGTVAQAEECRWCGSRFIQISVYPVHRSGLPQDQPIPAGIFKQSTGPGTMRPDKPEGWFLARPDVAREMGLQERQIRLWCHRCQNETEGVHLPQRSVTAIEEAYCGFYEPIDLSMRILDDNPPPLETFPYYTDWMRATGQWTGEGRAPSLNAQPRDPCRNLTKAQKQQETIEKRREYFAKALEESARTGAARRGIAIDEETLGAKVEKALEKPSSGWAETSRKWRAWANESIEGSK